MPTTLPTCLIRQSACGRIADEPICPKCGIDERVRYVSEEAALLSKAQAQARYWKSQLENARQNEQAKGSAANGVPAIPVELTNKTASVELMPVSKDEQKNADSKLEIWHAQLASKISRSGDGELSFERYKEHFLKEWTDYGYRNTYKKRFGALEKKYGPYFGVSIILLFICLILFRYFDGTLIFSFNYTVGTLLNSVIMLSFPCFVIASIGVLFSMKNFKQDREIIVGDGYQKFLKRVRKGG